MVIEWGFITQKCEFLELFIKRIVDVMAFHQENVVMKQEMPGDIGIYLLCRKSELRSWRLVSYPAIWWPLFSNRKRTCVWSMLTNLVRVINSTIGFSSIYIYIIYIYIWPDCKPRNRTVHLVPSPVFGGEPSSKHTKTLGNPQLFSLGDNVWARSGWGKWHICRHGMCVIMSLEKQTRSTVSESIFFTVIVWVQVTHVKLSL